MVLGTEGFKNALSQIGLKEALLQEGINPKKIAEKINVLLEATKQVYKNNNESGEIELVGESPDYQAIDKGISHASKIYGIVNDSDKPKQGGNTYNFIFSEEVQGKVKAIETEIKKMLIKPNVKED